MVRAGLVRQPHRVLHVHPRAYAGIDGLPPNSVARCRDAEEIGPARIVASTPSSSLCTPRRPSSTVCRCAAPRARDPARQPAPTIVVTGNLTARLRLASLLNQADHTSRSALAVVDAVGDAGTRWLFRDLDRLGPRSCGTAYRGLGRRSPSRASSVTKPRLPTFANFVASLGKHSRLHRGPQHRTDAATRGSSRGMPRAAPPGTTVRGLVRGLPHVSTTPAAALTPPYRVR